MKNYLVFGLGLTGISAIKTLSSMGNRVYVYEDNTIDIIEDKLQGLDNFNYEIITDIEKFDWNILDIMVKSPGITMENEFIRMCQSYKIEIISDLELAYRLFPDRNLLSLTGTNGKTTTTALLTEIINNDGKSAKAIGNIGVGMLWELYNGNPTDYYVIECSSFQLETTLTFRTHVTGIINITPDHIDWHGSLENYINAKGKILDNQRTDDYAILNIDDKEICRLKKYAKGNSIEISLESKVDCGIYIENGTIYSNIEDIIPIIRVSDLGLIGRHNLQNTLVAIGMAIAQGISIEAIKKTCMEFKGVSHRMEFVREINGVKFYNDSKGTNVDASIKAIESFNCPIILIAGGYDKGVPLDDFILAFNGKVKKMILMGQTREKFRDVAKKYGFEECVLVDNMEEAIDMAIDLMNPNDVVLLSPASASWGMYPNFEVRGDHFKSIVNNIGATNEETE